MHVLFTCQCHGHCTVPGCCWQRFGLLRSTSQPVQAADLDRQKFRGVNVGGTMGPMDLERGGPCAICDTEMSP